VFIIEKIKWTADPVNILSVVIPQLCSAQLASSYSLIQAISAHKNALRVYGDSINLLIRKEMSQSKLDSNILDL